MGVALYTQVCNLDSCVHMFYMWVARRKVAYNTRRVQRTIVYAALDMKRLCRDKIKVFYMNLMFDYWLVTRLKHGVGVEGEGA